MGRPCGWTNPEVLILGCFQIDFPAIPNWCADSGGRNLAGERSGATKRVSVVSAEPALDMVVRNSSWSAMLTVSGELDMATAPQFSETLSWLLGQNHHQVTVDLGRVSFVDSSGLAIFIRAHHEMTEMGGRLVLSNPSKPVRRLLDVTGLGNELTIQA
jgi:anti-sigma B factor antagonist